MSEETIEGLVISLPAIIKASFSDGRRLVNVEASVEMVDSEGDLILQRALLDSAPNFIMSGHLDINHISEIGERYGYKDTASYIVGKPLEVHDIGEKRTSVLGEITRSADGSHNPGKYRYDRFWDTFFETPPIDWRASIYGYPKAGEVIDCSQAECEAGAWRYIIKGLDWRSLAFTQTPVNDKIASYAQIVTAKAFVSAKSKMYVTDIFESLMGPPIQPATQASMAAPRNLSDALGQYYGHIERRCPHAAGMNSTIGFRSHFEHCCGMDHDMADVFGHALMHHILLHRRRNAA